MLQMRNGSNNIQLTSKFIGYFRNQKGISNSIQHVLTDHQTDIKVGINEY